MSLNQKAPIFCRHPDLSLQGGFLCTYFIPTPPATKRRCCMDSSWILGGGQIKLPPSRKLKRESRILSSDCHSQADAGLSERCTASSTYPTPLDGDGCASSGVDVILRREFRPRNLILREFYWREKNRFGVLPDFKGGNTGREKRDGKHLQ